MKAHTDDLAVLTTRTLETASGDTEQPHTRDASAYGLGVHPRVQRYEHGWHASISIFASDDDSHAHVVLVAPTKVLTGSGHCRRGDTDGSRPEVRDQVAVARALRDLSDELFAAGSTEAEHATGQARA